MMVVSSVMGTLYTETTVVVMAGIVMTVVSMTLTYTVVVVTVPVYVLDGSKSVNMYKRLCVGSDSSNQKITHKVIVEGQPTSRVVVTSGKLNVVGVERV